MKRAVIALWIALPLFCQDTQTEKEAARDVLRQMGDLEKSLDIPGLVAKLTAPNSDRDKVVARAKQLMDSELLALGDSITKDPEIGFQETRSVERLMTYLKKHNFEMEQGIAGLRTAFVGRYKRTPETPKSTGPNMGIVLEYDALRGTKGAFHGDQHSTQGPIGIAAALAIAEYLDEKKLPAFSRAWTS
jgi:hypothetical protein